MVISIICAVLFFFSLGVFEAFVISKLREIDSQTDSTLKYHWSMSIYMNDIPQTDQNIACLGSVSLKIYKKGEYSDFIIPRVDEEIHGIYHSGENKFALSGIVTKVFYNTDIDFIVVECKCTDIQKLK